jgi:phosphate ABC transporter phosphate-binding protein
MRVDHRWRRVAAFGAVLVMAMLSAVIGAPTAAAFVPVTGAGSTWSFNAIHAWQANVAQNGLTVDYNPVGSTTGRNQFKDGRVDFAASDIPYGVKDGNNNDDPPQRGFAYMPVTAGGTTFMYNLKIGPNRVTNLRLSGPVVAGIFTGAITTWNDPQIAQDNPALRLPAIPIVPVVRSDGSGSTAQFTQWMVATQGPIWNSYCARVGRNPCTQTSAYPTLPGSHMVAQSGDLGVSGYVSQQQSVGTIGYVEYSYALETGFPVAKIRNSANYYTEPTAGHVAVSLLAARINPNQSDPRVYLTQDLSQVYVNTDARTYPLSSYSYMILPTTTEAGLTNDKGNSLAAFGSYAVCGGQSQVDALGYSALPINLVQASFDQLKKIPGANVGSLNIQSCHNPTFSTDGTNTLAKNDPMPPDCDKAGPTQCATGTGGAGGPVSTGGGGGGGGSGGGGSGSGAGAGGGGPTSNAPTNAPQVCDPETGACNSATDGQNGGGANNNAALAALPQTTSTSLGDGLQVVLMVLAAFLLIALGFGPPLIANVFNRRRARKGESQ